MYTPELMVLLSHDMRTGACRVNRVRLMVACQGALIADLVEEGVLRIDMERRPAKVSRTADARPWSDWRQLFGELDWVDGKSLRRAVAPQYQSEITRSVFILYRSVLVKLYHRNIILGADGPDFWFAHEGDWPPRFAAAVTEGREAIAAVVGEGAPPGRAVRGLLAALHACDIAHQVLGEDAEAERRVTRRCRELFESAEPPDPERRLAKAMRVASRKFG